MWPIYQWQRKLAIYEKLNSYFSEVTLLIADILSHDCFPFEKMSPKLNELPFMKKLHTVMSGSELVEVGDEPSQSSLCAFVHASTLSADWHRIIPRNQNLFSNKYAILIESLPYQSCMFLLTPPTFVLYFSMCFLGLKFHLVSATSMALTLFLSFYCLRAKGKWRILTVQTPMLQKGFQLHQLNPHAVELSSKAAEPCEGPVRGKENADAITVCLCQQKREKGEKRVMEQKGNCAVMQTLKA